MILMQQHPLLLQKYVGMNKISVKAGILFQNLPNEISQKNSNLTYF